VGCPVLVIASGVLVFDVARPPGMGIALFAWLLVLGFEVAEMLRNLT